MPNLIHLIEKREDDLRWPVDCLNKKINDYEEILIIANKKGEDGYTRFSTDLKSSIWWLGCLDAVKRLIADKGLVEEDEW